MNKVTEALFDLFRARSRFSNSDAETVQMYMDQYKKQKCDQHFPYEVKWQICICCFYLFCYTFLYQSIIKVHILFFVYVKKIRTYRDY